MKISFNVPEDGKLHRYCLQCLSETVTVTKSGRTPNRCRTCGHKDSRALIIDPAVNWWLARDGEYWHETAGIFVLNERGEVLLFERNKFPLGLTPPAGHVDAGEQPLVAAQRELWEETSIQLDRSAFTLVATENIDGDGCRRGADAHRWHAYAAHVTSSVTVKVTANEGSRPVWLTPSQALKRRDLTLATRYMLSRHADALTRA